MDGNNSPFMTGYGEYNPIFRDMDTNDVVGGDMNLGKDIL